MHAAILYYLLLTALVAGPDTLVICPAEFRPALQSWQELRERQGHRILVLSPSATADETQATIRKVGAWGQLRYLLLVGDVPDPQDRSMRARGRSIPTHYVPAKVNLRWGSESTIATDSRYADLDGDKVPDLAVGRIPADSREQLEAVVRKIIRYEEQAASPASGQERLHVVAGMGGFGEMTDRLLEAAARQVFLQTVPPDCMIDQLAANPASPRCPPPGQFASSVRQQLGGHSLAWIYMGHALPTELDRVRRPTGDEPILSVADVPQLHCGPLSPLAVLVACYAGAIDSRPDSLAEELVLAEEGPIAVIAATRVTMPYGNTVFGYELLRACFRDHPRELGDVFRLAQQRTLAQPTSDSLRASLDLLAKGLGPRPIDLEAERREHVWMYHLFGDPLTQLHRAAGRVAQTAPAESQIK